jgi:hypothetical protein
VARIVLNLSWRPFPQTIIDKVQRQESGRVVEFLHVVSPDVEAEGKEVATDLISTEMMKYDLSYSK